ncbi:sporulation protein [Cytobacillus horneckiae]|uniref:sporulation protein n=1 Tax=Cytobacillus horneckiae TaxID=549687 RepID=UPI003D9A65D0
MALFNKVLASVGIGAAKVDTKLHSGAVYPGSKLEGIVEVRGGKIDQEIDDIYLKVQTSYETEKDDHKYSVNGEVARFRLAESFIIKANEAKDIPFAFNLPLDTPVTIGKSRVWVSTELDIKKAIDPSDNDSMKVAPNKLMESVLHSINDLGFRMREVECEEAPKWMRRRLPFVQEFEFVAVSGQFQGRLDELEVVFFLESDNAADLFLQVDRRARGLRGFLSEALSMDESTITIKVTSDDIPNMSSKLQSVISQYI